MNHYNADNGWMGKNLRYSEQRGTNEKNIQYSRSDMDDCYNDGMRGGKYFP